MNISLALQKAYNATFRYRYLWWLSLFTIIGGVAQQHESHVNFQLPVDFLSDTSTGSIDSSIQDFSDKLYIYLPTILIVIGLLFCIFIFFYIIGLIAKSGQIDALLKIDRKEESSFWQSMTYGKQYAWRIFVLNFFYSIVYVASFILAIPLIIITLLLFFITIPLLWVYLLFLNAIFVNAEILVVKNNIGVIAAIEQSWQITLTNWKNILLLWVVKFGIGLAIGIIIFFFGLFSTIIAIILGVFIGFIIFAANLTILIVIGAIILVFTILIAILFSLLVQSILNTFFVSYWTFGINSLLEIKTKKR